MTEEEYEESSFKKRAATTATRDNLQVDKWCWQAFFEFTERKEEILRDFIYDQSPLKNFLALIDAENHHVKDNLKSGKQFERIMVAERLTQLLGW